MKPENSDNSRYRIRGYHLYTGTNKADVPAGLYRIIQVSRGKKQFK